MELNPGAQPVVDPPRRVPQALYEPLREKLKKLEEQGVIASVDEPTDWVNSLIITEKRDGSLRLCLDPKQLNKNIRREHFQIPTFTEVSTQLGGARLFTILDQKDSYWQVELDEESSKLCSFNTPSGDIVLCGCHSESPVQANCCKSGHIKHLVISQMCISLLKIC